MLGKVAAPVIDSIADKAAQQAISGLGGEANALYALVDNELRKLAANLAATPASASATPTATASAHASVAAPAVPAAESTEAATAEKAAA